MSSGHRRVFPETFKREAVERVTASGVPPSKVASELGLHETVLRRWMRQFTVSAGTAQAPQQPRVQRCSQQLLRWSTWRRRSTSCVGRTTGCGWNEKYNKNRDHLRGDGKMKFSFIQANCTAWPVRMMCAVPGISVSGYYRWQSRAESKQAAANRQLLGRIQGIHADSSGTYGSPRIHAVLCRTGQPVGRNRVETLMRRAGLRGLAALPRRTRTTDSRHNYPIAPNQAWLADLTYIPTGQGWLYLAASLDVCTRKIVGWSMRDTLHTEIASEALTMALERQRPAAGLIHHSDRGI